MQTDRPLTFPECNVQIIRENLELTQNKNASRFPSIALPLHCFQKTNKRKQKSEVVVGEEQMQYFSRTTGGTTCQRGGEVTEDLQGLLSVCCYVVPLRDLDLVTTFNAASFCVAFFSSLLYMEKLIHLVNVITYSNNSNNNDYF